MLFSGIEVFRGDFGEEDIQFVIMEKLNMIQCRDFILFFIWLRFMIFVFLDVS